MSEQHTSGKPPRFRRKVIVGTLVLTTTIGILLYLSWREGPQRLVEAEYAKIRAKGFPVTAEELAEWYANTPTTTDGTELYELAFSSYPSRLGDLYQDLIYDETLNTYYTLEELSPESVAIIRTYVAANVKSITLLMEAASKGPTRFGLDIQPGALYDIETDHLSGLRRAMRLLQWQLVVHVIDNKPELALETFHAMGRIAESLAYEPIHISQLTRIECYNIMSSASFFALSQDALADDLLVQWADEVRASAPPVEMFVMAYAGERCSTLEFYDRIDLMDDGSGPGISSFADLRDWAMSYYEMWRSDEGFFVSDQLLYLGFMERAIDIAQLSYIEGKAEREQLERELEYPELFRSEISLMRVTSLFAPIDILATSVAKTRLQLTIVAIERFRIAHGRIPTSLDELVPTFLDSVPIDPFNGNPLRYIPSPERYRIYSVGMNEVDDGGVKESSLRNGDIVFQVAR